MLNWRNPPGARRDHEARAEDHANARFIGKNLYCAGKLGLAGEGGSYSGAGGPACTTRHEFQLSLAA